MAYIAQISAKTKADLLETAVPKSATIYHSTSPRKV